MSFDDSEPHRFMCGCPLCAGNFAADDGTLTGGASAPPPTFTLSQIQTQLRTQWGGDQEGKTWTWLGTTNVTYSIDTNVTGVSESSGLVGMTTLMEDRARLAFELWDDVIALSLTESPANANANITFNYSSNTTGDGTYAWWNGYLSGGNFGISRAYVWLNSDWSTHSTNVAMAFGGYGFMTYLHEIGHTLGLSHPGTYDASEGGSITYANSAEYAQDSHRYTVMSYFYADEAEPFVDHYGASGIWKYATTPLLHDIAALQAAYGADTTTRTGDTIYGFHSNAGRVVFDFTQNIDPIIVIWDSGGTDTLDCSGYSANQFINLTAGSYSNVGSLTYNVAIAFDCVVENAIGGSGADTLIGNGANNVLAGGAGIDTLSGGAGVDTFAFATGSSGSAVGQRDRITDFAIGTDLIDLSGWDANSSLSGLDHFLWLGMAAFNGQAGGLRYVYDSSRGVTVLQGDTNGDNIANFAIELTGNLALTQAQFAAGSLTGGAGALPVLPFKGVGDFTGDGKNDILWMDDGGQLLFWRLHGASVTAELNVRTFNNSWFVRGVGDFNGDGKSDILMGNSSNAVYLMMMNGNSVILEGGLGVVNGAWILLGTGDFNGDSKSDILWRDSAGGVHIWQVVGTSVVAQGDLAAAPGLQFKGVGDFNGDGQSDVLWQDANGQVFYWEMDGTSLGSIVNVRAFNSQWFVRGVGDFNGDGKSDILMGNSSNAVYAMMLNGSVILEGGVGTVNSSWTLLGTGDVSGDGKSDILWRDSLGTVNVWQLDGTTLATQANLANGSAPPTLYFEGIGDFADDGTSDILWMDDGGHVFFSQMDGFSITAEGGVRTLNSHWFVRGTGDFNGDGNSDVLIGDDTNAVYVLQMNGSSVIGEGGLPYVNSSWNFLGTGDFNGDGKSDILWRDDARVVHIWEMNGTSVAAQLNLSASPIHFEGIGDFNGDGQDDILWQDANGLVQYWQMEDSSIVGTASVRTFNSHWFVRGVSDFNGDGKSDILVGDDTNAVYSMLMNGSAVIGEGGLPYVNSTWRFLGTGDVNGDGKSDILWRDPAGLGHIWQLNGISVAAQGDVVW
jgi:Ca2+-binding RTX toxin-like protein